MGSTDIHMMKAAQNERNIALSAAKSCGDFRLGHCGADHPDFADFLCCQKFLEAGDEPLIDGMLFVEPVINPLKIYGSWIGLDAVDVVDERKPGRVWNESDSDETMNVKRLPFAVAPKTCLRVPNAVDARAENLSIASLWAIWPSTHSVNAADSTEIADFVQSFKASDASPFFVDHVVGPFARSAHSIVVSSTTQGGPTCQFH